MNSFGENSKEKIVESIRNTIKKCEKEYKSNGYVEFVGGNNDQFKENKLYLQSRKIGKIFMTIWALVIVCIISYVIYNYVIADNMIISKTAYITIVILLFVLMSMLVRISSKSIKRISTISVTKDKMSVVLLNDRWQTESDQPETYAFDIAKIKIKTRRRKQSGISMVSGSLFNVYITYRKRKKEYMIKIDKKRNLVAFILFLESQFNGTDIHKMSDQQLYNIYTKRWCKFKVR